MYYDNKNKQTKSMPLLSHQYELIKDTKSKVLGLVSGFGAGKTYAVARKAVTLMLLNPETDGIITEPNFPLLTQILIPEMHKALADFGLSYEYRSGDGIFEVLLPGYKIPNRLICKSMEGYERLIGISASFCILDEFDTAKTELAYNAYLKLLGRLRVGTTRQMVIVSTPEGFKAFYRIFVEENVPGTPQAEGKRLIKAKTTDNYHLPDDYIETMRQQYPAELIDAYLNGEFVNLTQGMVYNHYDRSLHDTFHNDTQSNTLHIGMDFNVGHMSAVVCLFKDQKVYAVNEFKDYLDTPALIQAIEDKYPNQEIIVYPDASGKNRATNDAGTSNHKLLHQANFKVRVNPRNPGVQTRVNTVQARFMSASGDTHLYVNVINTPELVKGLEQQVYLNGAPDKTHGTDHMLDAFGYVVSFLLPLTNQAKVRKKQNYQVFDN